MYFALNITARGNGKTKSLSTSGVSFNAVGMETKYRDTKIQSNIQGEFYVHKWRQIP
jgi:hypothetical protein